MAADYVSPKLCEHFSNANDFLIKKMASMGEAEIVNLLKEANKEQS